MMEGQLRQVPEPQVPFFVDFLGKESVNLDCDNEVSDEDYDAMVAAMLARARKKRKQWTPLSSDERIEKIQGCGVYSGRSVNMYSGSLQAIRWWCRCWQTKDGAHCETCFKRRAWTFKKKLKDAYARTRYLSRIWMEHDKADKFLRGHDRNTYLRFPCKDGMDLIVMSKKNFKGTKGISPFSSSDFGDSNIDKITDTPEDLRTSGSLGSIPSKTPMIRIATARINPQKVTTQMEIKALFKAEKATLGANPKTLEEVKDCINRKTEVYARSIRAQGGEVSVAYVHKSCRLSNIAWLVHTEVNRHDVAMRVLAFPRNSTQNHGDEAFAALQGDSTVIH